MNKQIKQEMDQQAKEKREKYLAAIEAELPPIVFRNWPKWKVVLPFAPRTTANEDSRGEGPAEKVFIGRNCGYPKEAFMEYLRQKMRFTA